MVLESFQKIFLLKHKVRELFFISFLHTTLAMFLGLWMFPQFAGIIMIFFTVIPSIPFMLSTIRGEEAKDESLAMERTLLKEHSRVLGYYMSLFCGITAAFVFWYILLPEQSVQLLFGVQTSTISRLATLVSGSVASQATAFKSILINNLRVLALCILFSFSYGIGALFILTWNASVIGAAIGNFIRTGISKYAGVLGFGSVAGYFNIVSVGLLRYSIHGIPEILGYFTAGLAGGIISVAVIKQRFRTKEFFHTIMDSLDLVILSVGLIVIAALLEVYVTPAVFG